MSQGLEVASDNFERSRILREQRVSEMMDQVIYPGNVGREGLCLDTPWASTAAEAVSFAFDESVIPDELRSMDRVNGNVDLMLRERHVADIAMYARTGSTAHSSAYHNVGITEIAGFGFDESMNSDKAFGYNWYRKCTFALPVGRFVLLRPGMQPWTVGGSPFPRVYATSDTDNAAVTRVVFELCVM